ncbi:MAG: MSMEG_0569 family flavin-dependent oxidoreductase, partial [Polyangiales bacterium]
FLMTGRRMSHGDRSHLAHYPVIIVGAGQAGLSISYCLTQRGIRHLVLERSQVGHSWRTQRWDSFCLVTPNWQCRLPGHPYAGSDPDGFMLKADILDYVSAYATSFSPPLQEGVEVKHIAAGSGGTRFMLETNLGVFAADQVVMATGPYHHPKIPAMAAGLADDVVQLDATRYRNPNALPPGAVMVVGSGQSGCQIAEDLHLAGREVHLCVGSAPRVVRRYRGRDAVAWLEQIGHYDLPIDRHPDGEAVRRKRNHYVTGRDGGRDIDLRKFAREGMRLHGRLRDIDAAGFTFDGDLSLNLDRADAASERIKGVIDAFITKESINAPTEAPYSPPWQPGAAEAASTLRHQDAAISSIVWCGGFSLDYSYIALPAFDETGYPHHTRGVSRDIAGLYFLGLPWMYTWGSGRFSGVGRDAEHLAAKIHELSLV